MVLGLILGALFFISEHVSSYETGMFNLIYELGENGEKLYSDNPLEDPYETGGE
jgi:hypothetical protein